MNSTRMQRTFVYMFILCYELLLQTHKFIIWSRDAVTNSQALTLIDILETSYK